MFPGSLLSKYREFKFSVTEFFRKKKSKCGTFFQHKFMRIYLSFDAQFKKKKELFFKNFKIKYSEC